MELDSYVDQINKALKGKSLNLLSSTLERQECLPFGIPSLDFSLNSGIPKGTMVELFGAEGSGKTTLALHLLGQHARNGKIVVVVDAEHKLDPVLASNLGVDLSKFPLCQPESAEEAFEVIDKSLDFMPEETAFLVDSAAALMPAAEMEAGIGHQSRGGNAKSITDGISKIRAKLAEKKGAIIFINQLREKMGVFYGSNETTPCGHALKHGCATRIEVRGSTLIKNGDDVIGKEVNIKTVKCAHTSPYKTTNLKLFFGRGFSREYSLLDLARAQGAIVSGGAWIQFEGEKYHGEPKFVEYLCTPEGYEKVLSKVKI